MVRNEDAKNQRMISFVCSTEEFRLHSHAFWKHGSLSDHIMVTDKNQLFVNLYL